MRTIFYKRDDFTKHFSLSPFVSNTSRPNIITLWLANETGEGMEVMQDTVEEVIYMALEKFFAEAF